MCPSHSDVFSSVVLLLFVPAVVVSLRHSVPRLTSEHSDADKGFIFHFREQPEIF